MASFKNKIDLKKTKRFLSPFLSSTKKPISPFSVAKPSARFNKEEKFDKRIAYTSFFDYAIREKIIREAFYHSSTNCSNIDLSIKKKPLFSKNEVRNSKQINRFCKGYSPLLTTSACDKHMPHSPLAYSASFNSQEENTQNPAFSVRKDNRHATVGVESNQSQERYNFYEIKPIHDCTDTERYLQIFFHFNIEDSRKLDKSAYIKSKEPNTLNDYLRKKYKPFRFKSLTQRSQFVQHNIWEIARPSSRSSLSQKMSEMSYRRQSFFMRLSFLRGFVFPFCGCSTKSDACDARHFIPEKPVNESRFVFGNPATQRNMSSVKMLYLRPSPQQSEEKFSINGAKKGNHFVIVLKKNSFWLLRRLVKDNDIFILGGIYGKTPISQNTIFSLAKEIEEDTLYYRSISILQKKPSLFLSTLSNLHSRLWLTLCLLKDRKHRSEPVSRIFA